MKYNKLIGVVLVFIAVAAGYYFLYFLPSQAQKKQAFENQKYCEELGHKYSEQLDPVTAGNSEYVYSKTLNTCLFANTVTIINSEMNKKEYYILDLSTNKKLAGYISWNRGCDDCGIDFDSMDRYQKLYNENF